MGSTKVGKSTILNALIGGSGAMARDDDCNIVSTKQLKYDDQDVFEIGHTAFSHESPGVYLHEDIYFIEYPELGDFNALKHFENQTYLHFAKKNAKNTLIALIIGAA